jgi:alkylation response protein AidB-like acyl-CoA dehydrogenase
MTVAVTSAEEQAQLRETVREFLDDACPIAEVRRLMETAEGWDRGVWKQLAELGLPGLIVPEEHGGAGLGHVDLAIVFEELGRSLACVPYLSTVGLAASALLSVEDDSGQAELLPAIAGGETTATLAFTEDGGGWSLDRIGTRASESGDGWTLEGRKTVVVDGATADLVLVTALTPDGLGLFAVEHGADGLTATPLPSMDPTRKLARIELAGTPARAVGAPGAVAEALERTLDLAGVALAAEQAGGAARCVEVAAEYARDRAQFGRRIGSFQSIKHRCAEMLVDVESARNAAFAAAALADAGSPDFPVAASLAQAVCSEASFRIAADNIQVHGGIGFTWEHDAHLYFKRAKSSELLLGDAVHHRDVLGRRLGV